MYRKGKYTKSVVLITCVSVSLSELENSALSAILRYCLSLNFFSNASSCCVVNGVLGFLLGLCLRKAHRTIGGPGLELMPDKLAEIYKKTVGIVRLKISSDR